MRVRSGGTSALPARPRRAGTGIPQTTEKQSGESDDESLGHATAPPDPSTQQCQQEMLGSLLRYRLEEIEEVLVFGDSGAICYTGIHRQKGFVVHGTGVAEVIQSLRTLLPADYFTQK